MNMQSLLNPNRLTIIWIVAAVWLLILLLKSNEAAPAAAPRAPAIAKAPVVAPTTAPEPTPTPLPTSVQTANQPAAAPASAVAGDAEKGKTIFATTCAACHGPTGEGVPGLGKDMTTSTFIAGLSDEELLAFVKTGRSISDPLNTTKVDMPPKGGNPALQDAQIVDIIAFIRSIHKS